MKSGKQPLSAIKKNRLAFVPAEQHHLPEPIAPPEKLTCDLSYKRLPVLLSFYLSLQFANDIGNYSH